MNLFRSKTTPSLTTNVPMASRLRRGFLLAAFAAALFGISPHGQATCQEGCLTNNNTVLGEDALFNNTGADNTAVGYIALWSNTTGIYNTAIGYAALSANTTTADNTAVGAFALWSDTIAGENTAIGAFALQSNTTGEFNTATGEQALQNNTTGLKNTATGYVALLDNSTGDYNTATGEEAMVFNTTGNNNTASGYSALYNNTTANNNTASGTFTLWKNTIGFNNTATGSNALLNNTTGSKNMAAGFNALSSNTTGGNNIALGQSAGANLTTGSGNIDIGNTGVAAESKAIRIGTTGTQTNAYIAGISGATVPTGVPVIIDTSGHLGTTTSSAAFKEAIKPMDKTSEAILALQPVTFRYKHELDPDGIPQFGLVAEDVQKVNPDLVARDEQGKPYTVRYEAVNAMLLNEFLKEHKKVEQLEATVAKLAAAVEKVSAQMQVGRPIPQIALNSK